MDVGAPPLNGNVRIPACRGAQSPEATHGKQPMSWDLFVQDFPRDATSVDEIPDDFVPRSLGPRSAIIDAIRHVAPFADASDPAWVRIEGHGCEVEVNLGDADPVRGFAFHVRGSDASIGVVAAILDRLGLRAFDPRSDTGIFDAATAHASRETWMAFRDHALGVGSG
jgi:hypothetical protein